MLTSTFTNTPDIRAAATGGSGAGKSSWISALWTAGSEKRYKEVQRLSDDGTNADEILGVTRALTSVSLIFSTLFCFLFYKKYLAEGFPIWAAIGGALIIAVLIESGKIWFGIRALRMLFNGKPLASFAMTLLLAATLAFSSVAFFWSFRNSTSGLHDLATSNMWQKNQTTFNVSTADIDQQIADARNSQSQARKITWKGTVTVDAQRTIRKQEENIARLQAQKEKRISDARTDYERNQKFQDENTARAAGWTQLVGGIIEGIQVLLLVIGASCEKILLSRNTKAGQQPNPIPSPSPNGSQFGQPASDYQSHPTFFNRGTDGNVIRATAPQTHNPVAQAVPQDYITATDVRIVDAEKVLRHHRSEMSKWIGHFNRKDAPGTPDIVTRLLTDAHNDINRMGQGIEPEAVDSFCDYVENRIGPKLADAGKPYAGMGVMLATLRGKARRTDTPPAPIAEMILSRYERMEGASA